MWKLVFWGWCRHIYAYWLQFSEFLEINSLVKLQSALGCSPPWLHQEIGKKNTDNNPAVRTVLTWQRVQLTPKRQKSALKRGPRWYDLTSRGETYHHQSGRDLRVKTRVWTFSPQIESVGILFQCTSNILCTLESGPRPLRPPLSAAIPVLPHNWRTYPIYYWKVPLSSDKNARHSPWDKPPCPSCTSARPSRDYSLWTKGQGFQQALSIDVGADQSTSRSCNPASWAS
jgi:hypothetical protein